MTAEKTIRDMRFNITPGMYTKIVISQCCQIYNDYWVTLGNVVVVTNNHSILGQVDDMLLIYAPIVPSSDEQRINGRQQMGQKPRQGFGLKGPIYKWYLDPGYLNVDYWLVQSPAITEEHCHYQYFVHTQYHDGNLQPKDIAKTYVMYSVWYSRLRNAKTRRNAQRDKKEAGLCTLGDAVASFMRDPDVTTKATQLATRKTLGENRDIQIRSRLDAKPSTQPKRWPKESSFWNSGVAPVRAASRY